MITHTDSHTPQQPRPLAGADAYQLLFFSELVRRPVCVENVRQRLGRLTDIVFRLSDPYPEAVGLYLEHGWGKPSEFIPWECVIKIDEDVILVRSPGSGTYPPFQDQPGWILAGDHLMGRTILDMDARTVEVVNDVHLLESKGRMLIVHVDTSFNGFLRKWGLGRISWIKDDLISWRYVQPFSLEDAGTTDAVSLSVTRKQLKELPCEDLADALEMLFGKEQEVVFSLLEAEKAAETLVAAEPRTQRQLVADLRNEKARTILAQMSVPQMADLFSVLPHSDVEKLIALLPDEGAGRLRSIISEHETVARALMSDRFFAVQPETTVAEALKRLRWSGAEREALSYLYVVVHEEKFLRGVVDLRDLVLAPENDTLGDIMVTPVVSAQEDDTRETLEELLLKYHFRMVPVVDRNDRIMGVIRYNDIMTGVVMMAKR